MSWWRRTMSKEEKEEKDEEIKTEINITVEKEKLEKMLADEKERLREMELENDVNKYVKEIRNASEYGLHHISKSLKFKKHLIPYILKKLNEDIPQEDEWTWVLGYKGTDEDLKCRDYQFEMDKEHSIDGEVKLCVNGFHFCMELEDVFGYYPIFDLKNRFFTVKAQVRKKDLYKSQNGYYEIHTDRFGECRIYRRTEDKIVAKSIKFVQELGFEELKNHVQEKYSVIETEKDWIECKSLKSKNKILCWYKTKIIKEFIENKMSESLATVLLSKISSTGDSVDSINRLKYYRDFYVGMVETGMSNDMIIYLLIEEMKGERR